ncbi:MAG TPA: hypothetical protein VK737_05650 [Opitutales bacterium]|nr:hypothetical protein [Opitutales bacterium]
MNPEKQGWDQNLKLDKGFLVAQVLVSPMVIWVAWPMLGKEPGYAQVAGCIVLSFCASIVVHTFCKIFSLLFIKKEISKTQVRALLITVAFIAMAFLVCWKLQGAGQEHLFWMPGAISCLAIMVYHLATLGLGKER